MNSPARLVPAGARVCIVGGGTSGILAAKACLDEKLLPTVFEQTSKVGGVWRLDEAPNRVAYKSLYTNSSGRMMCVSDFPIDAGLQDDFPRRQDICSYYEAYVRHFDLAQYIRHGTEVISVSRQASNWAVTVIQDGQEEHLLFDAVFVCTGQFSQPVFPELPPANIFKGTISHSATYRDSSTFHGKRLVIVGIGNSALDISLEAARNGCASVVVLCRSGTNIIPVADYDGKPLDQMLNTRLFNGLPALARNLLFYQIVRGTNAAFHQHGMPPASSAKDSAGFSNLKEHVAYRSFLDEGKISFVTGGIEQFRSDSLVLSSGQELGADEIIFCTGYKLQFPFLADNLSEELVVSTAGRKHLNAYKLVMHPTQPTLCALAFLLTFGNESCVAEMQARWALAHWVGRVGMPSTETLSKELKRRRKGNKYPQFLPYSAYMDELAAECGVSPPLSWGEFLKDPVLTWKMLTAPLVPAQYRLAGSNAWPAAADFIRSQPSTVGRWLKLLWAPPDANGARRAVPPVSRL